jgi:TonB family protein
MGRVGLRTVLQLHWCMLFCAALATANISAAFGQTHPPKIVPPAPNSALNSSKDSAPAKVSSPDEAAARNSDSASAPVGTNEVAASPPEWRADDAASSTSDSPSTRTSSDATPARTSDVAGDFAAPDGLPLAGARGVTHPVCLRCPPAQYSYSELLHKIQGNVTLDAIVGKDGWVSSVRILGSLGTGLDEQAMKAVRTWQWEPARDAEGKTVAAHQTVVVTFRIPR